MDRWAHEIHPLLKEGWLGSYYWVITAALVAGGGTVFLRLKPHFAGVL